ncbi:MAG TPA: FAD-dependent monooxygenase [Polyangiaceae bacterium]|nr:FAD-dependent monooxygenase [Polyangiaceae bacterium]
MGSSLGLPQLAGMQHLGSPSRFDVVIVGARCAGATLAALLARQSLRVLLIDRARLPSDLVLSTHTLHPAGSRVMAELGCLQTLQEITPRIRSMRLERAHGRLDLTLDTDDYELCPRRERFDGLLQQAAERAGAELRDRTRALGLIFSGTRVTGLRMTTEGIGEYSVHADWVVGADGRDSHVARWVNAEEYFAYAAPRACYWSYWTAPATFGTSNDYPGMYVGNRTGTLNMAFQTDHGQVLLGTAPELAHSKPFRANPLAALRAALAESPALAQIAAAQPCERVRGHLPRNYFFRQAVGSGWLLLGDAGIHKEFVTGDGMSEALLQARSLAGVFTKGTEHEFARWWHARDLAALPMYYFGKVQGAAGPPPSFDGVVFERAALDRALQRRFVQTLSHELSPFEVVPLATALWWLMAEICRGKWATVSQFTERGKILAELKRARDQCRAQLVASSARAVVG